VQLKLFEACGNVCHFM